MTRKVRDAVTAFVESRFEEQVRFLTDLCEQNSFTFNKLGADRVASLILKKVEDILPIRETLSQTDRGDHHILRNSPSDRSIYLLGHLDTVFPADHPFQSCRRRNDRLSGPGTADMKGGLAVFVYALLALDHAGCLEGIPITWILSADEEVGSTTTSSLYEAERDRALVCLAGECGGAGNSLVVSRNGKIGARLDVTGRDRHVGSGSHAKSSAVLELAHKVIALEQLNAVRPGVSLNVGRIEGGLGPSTIPGAASAVMDVRWVEEKHRTLLLNRIESIVKKARQEGCGAELSILNSRPAMPINAGTEKIFEAASEIGRSLGTTLTREHRRGTSDANFFGSAGIPTLDGLGPVGDEDHTPGEYILLSSLKERTILLALLIRHLGTFPRGPHLRA